MQRQASELLQADKTSLASMEFLPAAAIALNSLRENERASIARALKRLGSARSLPQTARRLPGQPEHFMLPVDPAWRVFFRYLPSKRLLVEDIMHREQLRALAGG
jgi:hypothetical protein